MWGTQHDLPRIAVGDRFIPTHVGNTVSQFHLIAARAVHPHACGEHLTIPANSVPRSGSSPRMWGTPALRRGRNPSWRFIPTHVGNTSTATTSVRATTVHPHACGEHAIADPGKNSAYGSSPRMWGTQAYRLIPTVIPRFIPTHVGNTTGNDGAPRCCTVHPHACGEHDVRSFLSIARRGSSPRMWGTLCVLTGANRKQRFIPTHVGNTASTGS